MTGGRLRPPRPHPPRQSVRGAPSHSILCYRPSPTWFQASPSPGWAPEPLGGLCHPPWGGLDPSPLLFGQLPWDVTLACGHAREGCPHGDQWRRGLAAREPQSWGCPSLEVRGRRQLCRARRAGAAPGLPFADLETPGDGAGPCANAAGSTSDHGYPRISINAPSASRRNLNLDYFS